MRKFVVLILYPATLLYSLISSSNFLVRVFRVFYVEDHVICKQQEFHFFSYLDSFTSFSALIAVTKTSKTMLNSSGESGHPCLVPDFKGNAFSFSPLRIMLEQNRKPKDKSTYLWTPYLRQRKQGYTMEKRQPL